MVDNAKSDGKRVANKSTYPRQHWNTVSAQLVLWNDEWHLVTYPTLVQVEDRKDRLDTNDTGKPVAR